MVKYFSVAWLAQSHYNTAQTEDHGVVLDTASSCRPHVPCMVQPRPPSYGESYLQPKPKALKPVEDQERSLRSPLHPTSCASPNLEMSGYSSGYESEAASSDCLSPDEVEKDGPQRRVRTKFTPEQISKLEKIFSRHRYLDAGERVKTAQKLSLSETQVRTWFQNRRMKLKREVQDYLTPEIPPTMLQPLTPLQYHSLDGQRRRYPATSALYPFPVPRMVLQHQIPPPHPYFY